MHPNTRRHARRQVISLWLYKRFKRKGMGSPQDPISWETIPKTHLFCHDQPNGMIMAHDCRTMLAYVRTQPSSDLPLNPLTRVPLDLADLWRLERQCMSLKLMDPGHHLGYIKNHLKTQTLRHKTVAMRRFVRKVRNAVKNLVSLSRTTDKKDVDVVQPDIAFVKTFLGRFLEVLYLTETSIARDVVHCIGSEMEGWAKEDLAWLHTTAMELRQKYPISDLLSSQCMDPRVSVASFQSLLNSIHE